MIFVCYHGYFRNKITIGDKSIIGKVFFVKRGFFEKGLMRNDLRGEGNMPVRRDRLTINNCDNLYSAIGMGKSKNKST